MSQHVEPRHLKLAIDDSLGSLLDVRLRKLGDELRELATRLAVRLFHEV